MIFPSRTLFAIYSAGLMLVNLGLGMLGPIGMAAYLFCPLYMSAWVLLFFVIRTFPDEMTEKNQRILIFAMSVTARLCFLFFPVNSDVSRYIWEGYILNQGFNPYIHAPDAAVLQPFINDFRPIWQTINHKYAGGCYPPFSMLLFQLAAFISPSVLCFKIMVILFDLSVIAALLMLAHSSQLPAKRTLLYALNPLVLVFIAGEAHLDPIQTFFICLSFYFFIKKKESSGFFSMGIAVMSKYFALIFAPFLINARNLKKSLYMLAAIIICYLPFPDTGFSLFSSLVPFGTKMYYNDSLTVLLRYFFGSYAVFISIILLGVCFFVIFLLVHDPLKSSYLAAGCLLMLIATLHPWYLTLITPFMVFFPSRAWLFLHISVMFTFPGLYSEYHSGTFYEIGWLKLAEYLPFYCLMIWDTVKRKQFFQHRFFRQVSTVSVIIPTLNEAENIGSCLENIRDNIAVAEIIVADAGSSDNTQSIANSMGATVVQSPKGRGYQINAGIAHSHGDVILVIHSDCRLHKGIPSYIVQMLNERPDCIGGAVEMNYLRHSVFTYFMACLNNARAVLTGISFGDQAQFFRKEALPLIGGFPNMMLMEDIELAMRLKENGNLCFIPKGVGVSCRRWNKLGVWKNFRRVIWFCLCYLIQRRLLIGDKTGQDFYKSYYLKN